MLTLHSIPEGKWPEVAGRFSDLTFEQSCTYARAAAARIGARVEYLLLEEAGQPVAAAAVRIKTVPGLGRGIAWIASGPLLHPLDRSSPGRNRIADILDKLHEEICVQQGHVLRLRPAGIAAHDEQLFAEVAVTRGFTPTERATTYASIAINLAQDRNTLMANLNGKWRTDLRYALKSDLTLDVGPPADLATRFLALYEQVQSTKGFRPDITPEFHFSLDGPDFSREILIATKQGTDIAGIVVGVAGQTATYLFGATAAEGRRLKAGYFLTWEGVVRAQSRGLHWYDLGGVDIEANPDVTRFKTRMNGQSILAKAFEARPASPISHLVTGLEALRTHLRRC
ncbi:lipid II:glycine glycyltransferase FemX [Kordiimonas sp.]|uniref:lipid II:glycine glycyltransferase FemX n=1 Tax=Kordiimonas sp. TaxID=1970157 RepID=UPI003A8C95D4